MGGARHREETVQDTDQAYDVRSYYSNNGGCASDASYPNTSWGTTGLYAVGTARIAYGHREMDDWVTDGFYALRRAGKIINTDMVKTIITESIPNFNVDIHYDVNSLGCTPQRMFNYIKVRATGSDNIGRSFPTNLFLDDTIDTETLSEVALTKAWANISTHQMLGLATLKEAGASLSGLRYLFTKVYKIAKAVRKAELKTLRRELSRRELMEIYMNARYNIRPLLYDANALVNIINDKVKKDERHTFRAKKETAQNSSDVVFKDNYFLHPSQYVKVRQNLSRTCSTDVTVRAGVLTSVKPVSDAQLFGLNALFETAWDLTPYSFILDWFINVGDTLKSWVPVIGVTPLASWTVVTTTKTQTSTIVNPTVVRNDGGGYYFPDGGTYSTGTGTTAFRVTTTVQRVPNPDRSLIPNISLNLDFLKLLDLGIIASNFKSLKASKYRL